MVHRDKHQPPKSDDTMTIPRRRFLQGGLAAAAADAQNIASASLPMEILN